MNKTYASIISAVSLLALFGCSKGPKPLKSEIFDLTQKTEIADAAFNSIIDGHPKGSSYDDYIASLPQSWRLVYTTYWLDCEVNNGGFHQFFWNSEGRWNKETEEDLREIGAEPFLKLFSEAKKIFEAHDYAGDKAKSGNSWEGFTQAYREKRMDELESIYYKEKKSLPSFLNDYLLRNRSLYERK